jgi:hypothetical protein
MAQRLLMMAGLASVFVCGFAHLSPAHDWYTGLTSSAGAACCGSAECRPAAARYNERTGLWETEVIRDTWLPVPPGALAPIPSPDGKYHVCEYAGTIRCFFQPGQVKRDPLEGGKERSVAQGLSRFPPSSRSVAMWPPQSPITSVADREGN